MFTCIKQTTFYLDSNCQFSSKFTHSQLTGRHNNNCGRQIIAIAAVDAIDVNSGFKQFVIAVDSYAAITYDLSLIHI